MRPSAFLVAVLATILTSGIHAQDRTVVVGAKNFTEGFVLAEIMAQLLESRLINLLHFQTVIASKAARMVLAAQGRALVDFGLRRAHGAEAGILAARASYLAGFAASATTPAAANTPACRIPPPSLFRFRRAVSMKCALPARIEPTGALKPFDRQNIIDIQYSPKPLRIFDKNGNRYAEFIFDKPEKKIEINIGVKVELFKYDLVTAKRKRKPDHTKEVDLDDFLKSEKYIEKDNHEILKIADGLGGRTEEEIVRNIYNCVIEHLAYTKHGKGQWGAIKALRAGKGVSVKVIP